MKELTQLREKIDKIDEEILRLFNERMDIAFQIGEYKKEHGLAVFDPVREQEKLSAINDPYAHKLFLTLFELSRECQSTSPVKILVINGPNLNMLGIREPEIYGNKTYADLVQYIKSICDDAEIFQSNHEGEIVDAIHKFALENGVGNKTAGIVINPAAFTHTSIAIYDALKAAGLAAVEVHLSDVSQREDFRKVSYAGMACVKTFAGMGFKGYESAVRYLKELLSNHG
jgi:3-dehydroquinate dehydratase-2